MATGERRKVFSRRNLLQLMGVGGAAVLPREVIPVASEKYIGGHRGFHAVWAPDLGTERAGAFYEFMREMVFDGVEYPTGI